MPETEQLNPIEEAPEEQTKPSEDVGSEIIDADPYEKDSHRWTPKKAQIAGALANVLKGNTDKEKLEELEINFNETLKYVFEVINSRIESAYDNFKHQLKYFPIPESDKEAIEHPEKLSIKMTPLLDSIKNLVARFLVQYYGVDYINNLSKKEFVDFEIDDLGNTRFIFFDEQIRTVLFEGFEKYLNVYRHDIPFYDKLYKEFDDLRQDNRNPLEVYLGRDGIYAFQGRRAQDVARRRALGLAGRRQAIDRGDIIEIHPKYIVYPRHFRDNLTPITKKNFLSQEGIKTDFDPIFYDTGFSGSIPEDIMRIMGFSNEEIDKRIFLLSASDPKRRLRNIDENVRDYIVNSIEHNSKLEESAEGLVSDSKTGKIRPIAKPTDPQEQFYYMMIEQAIRRHYYLKERLGDNYIDLLPNNSKNIPTEPEYEPVAEGEEEEGEFLEDWGE